MHSMDSNDLTLDRWLQTVSDEEAIRALTHALAVVKVRSELRAQTPLPTQAPVEAATMRRTPSLEQALQLQLKPEPDALANTKPLVAVLTEATQPPAIGVETDSSVASTFNRATARTVVIDRALLEPAALEKTDVGTTLPFGSAQAPVTKTLLFSAPSLPVPRSDSLEEALLVPQRSWLAIGAMLAAGALVLVGLGALVAAVLSSNEPANAVSVSPPSQPVPEPAEMTAAQTEEAILRARAASQLAADAKRVAAPTLVEEPAAAEVKKPARSVVEPLEKAPAPMVAQSLKSAPTPTSAPPAAPAHKPVAPAPVKKTSGSVDPLDSRR